MKFFVVSHTKSRARERAREGEKKREEFAIEYYFMKCTRYVSFTYIYVLYVVRISIHNTIQNMNKIQDNLIFVYGVNNFGSRTYTDIVVRHIHIVSEIHSGQRVSPPFRLSYY